MTKPNISIVMGSDSDFEVLCHAEDILAEFEVSFETKVLSAHRMPFEMVEFANAALARGIRVIIAGAGGAAHLPGMVASCTVLPVIGVPIPSTHLQGLDSLLSIVQMPGGIPVATMAIGNAGARNAALMAVSILALGNEDLTNKLQAFRKHQTQHARDGNDRMRALSRGLQAGGHR